MNKQPALLLNDRSMMEILLLATAGVNQTDIAKRVGLKSGQGRVSDVLASARTQGCFVSAPYIVEEHLSPGQRRALQQVLQDRGAQDMLRPHDEARRLQSVSVVEGGEDTFYRVAAGLAALAIGRATHIGVMWGRGVQRIVQTIAGTTPVRLKKRPRVPQVFPVCGDPLYIERAGDFQSSASLLAQGLARALGVSDDHHVPSLLGIPAYMRPEVLTAKMRRFLERAPGYETIFLRTADGCGLISSMDCLLTGVGTFTPDSPGEPSRSGIFLLERLKQERMSQKQMAASILGNFAGWLVAKPGSKRSQLEAQRLNRGWTGISGGQISSLAARAAVEGLPGVIVPVLDPSKAEMVVESVRAGLVNQLIVHKSVAQRIAELLVPARPTHGHRGAVSTSM